MEVDDKRALLTLLTRWCDRYLQGCTPWMKTVALALAAGYQMEKADADLTREPWSRLGEHLRALDTGRRDEALNALQDIESRIARQPPLSLISADADQIQAYVFESAKIPEVRGASALVEWLNLEGLKEVVCRFGLTEDVLVYQGGGGAMLLVPAVIADNVWQAIEEQFVATTHVATVTTVSHVVSMRDLLERDRFQKVRTALMQDLQITKLRKAAPVHFEWLPFARRCMACEVRPASEQSPMADGALLCKPCTLKRQEARRQPTLRQFNARLQESSNCFYLRNVPQAIRDDPNRTQRAEDLGEIGGLSREMLGVIAADGDGVGRILTDLNSLAEYRHFADKLYTLLKECVFKPLASHLQAQKRLTPNGEEWFHPFELIALGGDDLFLIVPANKAIPIAQGIAGEWDRQKVDVVPPGRSDITPPTLSLGLLICRRTFPLYFMHHLAEQLLQRAKSARSKSSEGFVDFLILKSSGVPRTEAGQIQEALYRYQERERYGQATLHLTERPYGLSHFAYLVQTAAMLREAGMTRTQRHALARSLRLGRLRSTMDVMSFWARRSESDENGRRIRKCLMGWLERLQNESAAPLVFPWRQDDQRRQETWTTQLLDVLELMEWLEVNESAATRDDGDVGGGDTA